MRFEMKNLFSLALLLVAFGLGYVARFAQEPEVIQNSSYSSSIDDTTSVSELEKNSSVTGKSISVVNEVLFSESSTLPLNNNNSSNVNTLEEQLSEEADRDTWQKLFDKGNEMEVYLIDSYYSDQVKQSDDSSNKIDELERLRMQANEAEKYLPQIHEE